MDELAVAASVVPTFDAEGRSVALLADLPGVVSESGDGQLGIAGDLEIRLRDDTGREIGAVSQRIEALGPGVQVYWAHRVPGRSFTAEISFVGDPSEQRLSWLEQFPARDEAADFAWASSPLLVATRPGWRALRIDSGEQDDLPYPFVGADLAVFLPIAEQQVLAGESVEVTALVAAPRGSFPFLRARWAGESAAATVEARVEILSVAASPMPGLWWVRARIGAATAPGRYGLRLAFVAADGSAGALSPQGVFVRVVEAQGLSTGPESALVLDPRLRHLVAVEGAETVWLAALRILTESGFEPAVTAYAEATRASIRDAVGRISHGRLEELETASKTLTEQLVRRQPRAALPIAVLHAMAHRSFLASHEARLMSLARTGAYLAVENGRSAGDEASEALGADVLSLVDPAAALETDPAHRLALLRVAIGNPLVPASDHAAGPLRKLVTAYPDDTHARLRLGIVLRRRGDLDAAARELAAAADGEGASWCREVAFGELAALEESRGRLREAEEALRRGIAETAAPQLYLQLGAYLDDWNRPQDAVSIVNRMPVARAAEIESGRHRMKRGAEAEIVETLERVAEEAERQLDALRTALAENGGTR